MKKEFLTAERLEAMEKVKDLMKRVTPRRPYDDEYSGGYLESDNDFVHNNFDVVVEFLEAATG